MIDKVFEEVKILLDNDNSGHGLDHIERVRKLSVTFAQQEGADIEVVELAALLHEVDDYKIFGEESAKNLTNATRILEKFNISSDTKDRVLEIISTMGYNKYLENIRPTSLEGMIVSDADMCDSIGAQGILRTHAYNASIGNPFFDKSLKPEDNKLTGSQYRIVRAGHCVQHFFDKLLKIPSILSTESGKIEGKKREKIMVDFLSELFREEDSEDWNVYLKHYLVNL